MKRIMCIALAVMLVFSLVGCQNSGDGRTSVTLWAVPLYDEFETDLKETFIPAIEEKYQDIKINLEMQTWEGVQDKLQMALQSGNYPDVFLDGTARCAALPGMGVLVPVDDIYNEIGGWYDSVSNIGVIDGVHYLIPASAMAGCSIAINMDLARELGVDTLLPEDRMNWDIQDFYVFVEACAKAGAAQDIQGTFLYAGSSTSDDALYSLLMSNGGQIIDKETMTCTANSEACVEVIETLGNIVSNGYAVPGAAMLTGGDATTMFLNQKFVVAINRDVPSMIRNFQQMVDEGYLTSVPEIRTYGIPHASGVDMESVCWGANTFAIFKNEDETVLNAAKTVVKELASMDEVIGSIWKGTPSYSPAHTSNVAFEGADQDLVEEVEFVQNLTSQYANSDFGILETYWPEIRNCFYPELQAVFNGDKTAQEAMDSFVKNVNEILAKQK